MGSSFYRQGAAYLKERLVIFEEDYVITSPARSEVDNPANNWHGERSFPEFKKNGHIVYTDVTLLHLVTGCTSLL